MRWQDEEREGERGVLEGEVPVDTLAGGDLPRVLEVHDDVGDVEEAVPESAVAEQASSRSQAAPCMTTAARTSNAVSRPPRAMGRGAPERLRPPAPSGRSLPAGQPLVDLLRNGG